MTLFLNVKKLKAALVFAAEKDVRTYLCGVNVNLAKNRVEATNGHALIVIDNILWEENEVGEVPDTNFIINRNDLNAVFKTLDRNATSVKFTINDDEQTAKTAQLGNLICYPLDGHFPNVDKLLNQKFSATPPVGVAYPAFQICYLEKVGKAMKAMKIKHQPYWRPDFYGTDTHSSCMQVIDDMKIMLMPCRVD